MTPLACWVPSIMVAAWRTAAHRRSCISGFLARSLTGPRSFRTASRATRRSSAARLPSSRRFRPRWSASTVSAGRTVDNGADGHDEAEGPIGGEHPGGSAAHRSGEATPASGGRRSTGRSGRALGSDPKRRRGATRRGSDRGPVIGANWSPEKWDEFWGEALQPWCDAAVCEEALRRAEEGLPARIPDAVYARVMGPGALLEREMRDRAAQSSGQRGTDG